MIVNIKFPGNLFFKTLCPPFKNLFYWEKFDRSDDDLVSIDSSFFLSRSDLTSEKYLRSNFNILSCQQIEKSYFIFS